MIYVDISIYTLIYIYIYIYKRIIQNEPLRFIQEKKNTNLILIEKGHIIILKWWPSVRRPSRHVVKENNNILLTIYLFGMN